MLALFGKNREKKCWNCQKLIFLKNSNFDRFYNPYTGGDSEYIIWEIGYFGTKAIKYNSIDAYARKLSLNRLTSELSRLKFSISSFFTLWQLSEDLEIRNIERYKDFIDRRYITLLAGLLEDKKGL